MRIFFATTAFLMAISAVEAHPVPPSPVMADLVLVNAHIWTVDRERPEVEAIAAWHGRILAVGSTTQIRTLIGPKTVVIDARGRRALPGFHDSHIHLLGSGLRLKQVRLKDAKTIEEFGKRLVEFDQKLPRDRWLIGGDWDHETTFAGRLPTSDDLDKFVRDRPVFLRRYDGHMALANSKALELAGITEKTEGQSGGQIVRDSATKRPTGILRDNAMSLIEKLIPLPDQSEITVAVQASLMELRQNGITSAVDMEGSPTASRRILFQTYQRLARAGELTARIEVRWPIAEWEELAKTAAQSDFGSDFVRIGGVKGYMDGSLGSNSAKMFEPYLNEAGNTGLFVTPRDTMRELIAGADRAGLSIAVHAIGDRANAELLDIFEDVQKQNGPRDRRFRIEHAQHLRPQDIPRFAKLGVVASMQPYHLVEDGNWAESRIGPERCKSSYAYRSLLDAGAKVALGSDWCIAPLNPISAIDAAVNRRTLDGKNPNGWFPAERIKVAEAIEAYTLTSAYASHQEAERGSIEPGKFADFVLLSEDVLAPPGGDALSQAKVLTTVVGGKIVFDARPQSER